MPDVKLPVPGLCFGTDRPCDGAHEGRPCPPRPRLVVTRGLPGSGKTSWAERQVGLWRAGGLRAVRVGWDDVRGILRCPGLDPEVPGGLHRALVVSLLSHVDLVVVDDCNARPQDVRWWESEFTDCSAWDTSGSWVDMVWADFADVPVEACVSQDHGRLPTAARVGKGRIWDLAAEMRADPDATVCGVAGVQPRRPLQGEVLRLS